MFLAPTPSLSDEDRERGLRHLVREAGYSNAVTAVTSGVILTAFALQLGASNTTIGLLAAVTFWVQLLQLPGVMLVEGLRTRKRISVLASLISRCALVGMALLALTGGGKGPLAGLVAPRSSIAGSPRSAAAPGTPGCATWPPNSGWARSSPGGPSTPRSSA
jgi:hypothetical protein